MPKATSSSEVAFCFGDCMFISEKNHDFASLVSSLKFEASFDGATVLVTKHLGLVQELLVEFIRDEQLLSNRDREALAVLSEESYFRLLASPYVCELLMVLKDQQSKPADEIKPLRVHLLQALIAEIRRVRPDYPHILNPQWTIGGDVVLDSAIAEKFPALQTDCGISLNYQSYVHNTGKDGIGGYSYETALQHKERIETGKKIIAAVSQPSLSMIEAFTTAIQFRQNKNRPSVVNSSTHTSIGLIRCDNFHQLHVDMPEVVDMLVHESIHQYLHLFEEQLFSFVDSHAIPAELLEDRAFASPWSGNPLDIRSYTHAILVWYGLVHFWQQYVHSEFAHAEVTKAHANEKLKEALFGFVNSASVLDNLGESKKYLSEEYVNQITEIQKQLKTGNIN